MLSCVEHEMFYYVGARLLLWDLHCFLPSASPDDKLSFLSVVVVVLLFYVHGKHLRSCRRS